MVTEGLRRLGGLLLLYLTINQQIRDMGRQVQLLSSMNNPDILQKETSIKSIILQINTMQIRSNRPTYLLLPETRN